MKRHLLGIALFNLIVGTALFVAIATHSFPPPAKQQFGYEVSKKSCWRNVRQNRRFEADSDYRQNSVKITQAVLNEKTNKLNLSFAVQRETPSTQNVRVKLTFINSELTDQGVWTKQVNVDYVDFSPDFNVENKAVYSMTYDFPGDLKSDGNLYVSAEFGDGGASSSSNPDAENADYSGSTPVLLTDKDF